MSGIVKGIKKVFRKVVKVVTKIAVPVLAAGAILFTGGAALGFAPLMGGWSAAAATVGSTLGGSGIIGSALTGAIYSAGQGALIGGAIAGISGGSVSEGMQRGAMAGAVAGGLSGAASGISRAAQPTVTGGAPMGPPAAGSEALVAPANVGPVDTGGTVSGGVTAGRGGLMSGLLKQGGWLERNQELVGNLVGGVGQGLMAGAEADAEKDLLRERHGLIAANYKGTDPGARFRDVAPGTSGNTPSERFSPSYYGSFEFRYDPKQGRIVKTPVGQ